MTKPDSTGNEASLGLGGLYDPEAVPTLPEQRGPERPYSEEDIRVTSRMLKYYSEDYDEETRLTRTLKGRIEATRMKLLIGRHVLRRVVKGASIADIGGGPGIYSRWMTGLGYEPALLDPVPTHVQRAKAFGIDAVLGDARKLPWGDATFPGAVMMGPLYHLKEKDDRRRSLAELRRVLEVGSPAVVTVLNRFTTLIGTTIGSTLLNHRAAVKEITATGSWNNGDGGWMSEAYYHTLDDFRAELSVGGFTVDEIVGVSGPGTWLGVLADRYLGPSGEISNGLETAVAAAEIADEYPETLVLSSMWAALVRAV